MREGFWASPGPRRVLAECLTLLARGDCLALRLPPGAPNLVAEIAASLPPQRAWIEIDAADCPGRAPDSVLRERLGLAPSDRLVGHASEHAEPVVAIRSGGRAWVRAALRHYHASRDGPGSARLILVLPAEAPIGHEDIGSLPVLDWRDRISRLDMHLFAAMLWDTRDLPLLERDLCIALTREVAGCCPNLAERIADAGPAAAFEPGPVLARFAGERGWSGVGDARWVDGTADRRDGVEMTHAAFAWARRDERTVQRCLWRAQHEVLFPVIEALRHELAVRYRGQLAGAAHEPLDIDIGPLARNLDSIPDVRRSHREIANLIHGLRNDLAHLRPLSRARALHSHLVDAVANGLRI